MKSNASLELGEHARPRKARMSSRGEGKGKGGENSVEFPKAAEEAYQASCYREWGHVSPNIV